MMATQIWLFLLLVTFATGYGIGLFNRRYSEKEMIEHLYDLQELLEDIRELGFESIEEHLDLESDPVINDLKKMIEESEFSSNDEM
jgi:flagellar motor component MotA